MFLSYGFIEDHARDSRLVIPQATHHPFGPRYRQTSTHGLFLRLLIGFGLDSPRYPRERFLDARLELPQSRELLEETLIEIL